MLSCIFLFICKLVPMLGLLSISKLLFSVTRWAFIYFLRPHKDLTRTYGSWALITGSTDGIGKAIALQLAAHHNLNVILVSRNRGGRLDLVADEIRRLAPDRSVKAVEVDFSSASDQDLSSGMKRIEEAVRGVDVGVLVNNVGVTYPKAMYFHELDLQAGEEEVIWRRVVRVNVEATTRVTKVVLRGMLKRGRGAVVNIGSSAGIVAPSHPLFAIYAATKAYIDEFSRSLHLEYKHMGIDVQCQVPLYVATKMASTVMATSAPSVDRRPPSIEPSLFTPTPQAYAKAAIRRIGYESRCTPYWSHSLQWSLASLVSDSLLDKWRLSIGLRRRAMQAENNKL